MNLRMMIGGLFLTTFAFGSLVAQEITKLTVAERGKVARVAEPITNGVPLPQGLVKDVKELALKTADGKDIPASFSVLNKWPADGSLRWVLLDTQLDVPAGGSATLNLVKGAAAVAKPVDVKETADAITVDTGAVKFMVSKKNFRMFDSLELNGKPVLAAPAGGLTAVVEGKEYSTAADKNPTVSVEEKTDMRVCVLAKGKLTDKAGKTTFDYEVRINAYQGRPEVKVVATVINKFSGRNDAPKVSDLSIELPLAGQPQSRELARTYAFGTENAPATGDLRKSAYLNVESSDHYVLGGDAKGEGKCKSVKPLTLGWGDIAVGDVGVAAGVRRFWENFPKAIEAQGGGGEGKLIVHLYPSMQKDPVEVYTGMARTHEVLIVPHGKATPAELQAKFVAFQRPLYAFASPKWYCRDSSGLGVLAEAAAVNPGIYGPYAEQVKTFDAKMSDIFGKLAGPAQDDWHGRGGVVMDAYGWLAYGDTLHYVWLKGEDGVTEEPGTPWTIAWDSNYYDMPHMALSNFARTGDPAVFDFFVDHSWHLMDIDAIHYMPEAPNGGGSRRCPASNHVGFDPPDHKSVTPNYAFDHHKSESLFERYYFLGDRYALEAANELLGHAFNPKANGGKDGNYEGTRKPAHQTLTLVAGYWCTGDKKYLEKARKVIATGLERQKQFGGGLNAKPAFTDGILSEAWTKYYLATDDQDVLAGVMALNDFLVGQKFYGWGNPAMGFGLAFAKTGDVKYAEGGLKCLTAKPQHLGKDSADMFRNAANFLGFLAQKLQK